MKFINQRLAKGECQSKAFFFISEVELCGFQTIIPLYKGSEKARTDHSVNGATFLEKNHIWPGTEDLYFNPESNKTPIIIQTHRGKTDVKLWFIC